MNLESLTIATRGLVDSGKKVALCIASDGLLKTASKIGGRLSRAAKRRLERRAYRQREELEIIDIMMMD